MTPSQDPILGFTREIIEKVHIGNVIQLLNLGRDSVNCDGKLDNRLSVCLIWTQPSELE